MPLIEVLLEKKQSVIPTVWEREGEMPNTIMGLPGLSTLAHLLLPALWGGKAITIPGLSNWFKVTQLVSGGSDVPGPRA